MTKVNIKKSNIKKRKKTVLITGADGFIGSHLTELLLKKGYCVKALSFYNSFNNWGWLEEIKKNKNLEILSGDIRDYNYCEIITKDIEIVFHLAALIAIPYSYSAPESYIDTNIRGTYNICQASLKNNVKRVIQTSTSEVYGTAQYVPIDEFHPTQPQSPYSASKIASDAVAQSFYNSYNLPVVTIRPFNTYGPRQSARAIIPTIISQIASNKRILNIGDTSPTRDFTYVTDTCRAILSLSETRKIEGEVVNIGSGAEISIQNLISLIKNKMNSKIKVKADKRRLRPKNSEVHRLLCDNSKLLKLTNFKHKVNLIDGISKTISWFSIKENMEKYKPDKYNV